MMLLTLTPKLMVPDVEKAVKFYRDILNFTVIDTIPQSPPFTLATLRSGTIELIFQSQEATAIEIDHSAATGLSASITLRIRVHEIRALAQGIQGKAQVIEPLHQPNASTETFTILDVNGYLLNFVERRWNADA